MPATIEEARDQMNGLLKAKLDTDQADLVCLWDDKDAKPPEPPTPWARVKILHSTGGSKSLGNVRGKQRYTRGGFVVVQLFTVGGKGLVSHDQIVAKILGAYEGKTTAGGLVFRNGRFQEVGRDGPWHQTNLFVDFEYDQIL